MTSARYPQWSYAAALASLPLLTHRRLRWLLQAGPPSDVWQQIQSGHRFLNGIDDAVWSAWGSVEDSLLISVGERCIDKKIEVLTMSSPSYPASLVGDPEAPAVLFTRGDTEIFRQRRVGIIGTRAATARGKHFARTLGAQLSTSGVAVVSGLARGIDVESHAGVLSTAGETTVPPIAVVASGLDVVYPREHGRIWEEVATRGVLVSESPPGVHPEPFRFPMRNRIIAALSEVLVVVESRSTGGSMSTVREAMKRDVSVMAVPGSPGLRQSEGTNDLLRDGCAPVTCVDDVLMTLNLDHRRALGWCDTREALLDDEKVFLHAMGRGPRSMEEVAMQTTNNVVTTAVLLGRLEAKGWVANTDGWWEALVA
jgi:DNA processing protein